MTARARLQAPRDSGAVLADPPLTQVGRLLRDNRDLVDQCPVAILGRPLAELRGHARRAALEAAHRYLGDGGEPVPAAGPETNAGASSPLLLAGHQPDLFHPGVWIKNFALHQLAVQYRGTALNLVVDTDLARAIDLKVPAWEGGDLLDSPPESVHRYTIPLDRGLRDMPYEERTVADEAVFASVPSRVAPLLECWPFAPVLADFWKDAVRASQTTHLLGERLAFARRAWERRWGCHNWEVPVSHLCRTEAFAWYACHLLAEAPRFHSVYNACVHENRRRNGIKDRFHPVPDLARHDDWLETPFWGWRAPLGAGGRRRLMVRQDGGELRLRLDDVALPSIPNDPGEPTRAVAAWLALEKQGWKLRSRALTTTLFARLFLGDLFVHGIGGAKYDEITDKIIRRFYGLEPPAFLVLSATLRLPFTTYPIRREDHRRQRQLLRDLSWNPQRHLGDAHRRPGDLARLAAEKSRWIERLPESHRDRSERFRQLRALTAELRPFVHAPLEASRERVATERVQLEANAVLERRDYAFCLFPEASLRTLMALLGAMPTALRGHG